MSVVVPIKKDGKVFIGADSQATKVVVEFLYQIQIIIKFGK